jgi:DNA replication protein DnaC
MLSDFDPGWGSSPNGRTFQGAAAKLGKLWLDAWSPGVGALIYGVTGNGKTRLATALANELAMRRNYFSAQMVCVAAHIPSTGFDADKWRSKIRPAARRAHVLIIDNLRADFEPFRVSELADLCEHAVRDRRAVIFTTTLNPSQLVGAGAWGDVCSRIGEIAGKWRFDLGGTDFRQPKPTPDARQRAAGDFD